MRRDRTIANTGSGSPRRRRLRIATQFFVWQIAIVVAVVAVAGTVTARHARREYDRLYGERVLAIARSVAATPQIIDAFELEQPSQEIQPIAEAVRKASNADFVVVANRDQIRYSHPDVEKIGKRLSTDASDVLAGQTFVGKERGTLGNSMRGKTPVYDRRGNVIGIVSVGILQESIASVLWRYVREALAWTVGISLLLGGVVSWLVTRRLRKQTYNLDEESLLSLVEQREAVLGGIREGVIAFDRSGRVTVINENAAKLLGIPAGSVGRGLADLAVRPALAEVLGGGSELENHLVEADGLLLVNRRPVRVGGREIGWVVTVRDQTELTELRSELDGMKTSSLALRAQAHEFSNRLHTISGLLALGAYEDAIRFTSGEAKSQAQLVAHVTERIEEPAVAALLIAKSISAREHGAEVVLEHDSHLAAHDIEEAADLTVVLGNLIDNSLEALSDGGRIEVSIVGDDVGVTIKVADSGAPVPPAIVDRMFEFGVSTKSGGRGLGLGLVRRACTRRGGWVRFDQSGQQKVLQPTDPSAPLSGEPSPERSAQPSARTSTQPIGEEAAVQRLQKVFTVWLPFRITFP